MIKSLIHDYRHPTKVVYLKRIHVERLPEGSKSTCKSNAAAVIAKRSRGSKRLEGKRRIVRKYGTYAGNISDDWLAYSVGICTHTLDLMLTLKGQRSVEFV